MSSTPPACSTGTSWVAAFRRRPASSQRSAFIRVRAPRSWPARAWIVRQLRRRDRHERKSSLFRREGLDRLQSARRHRSFESPTFRGLSNPELEEERLRGGDLGVEIRRGSVAAQINGFYNRLENFVGSAEVGFVDGKFTVQASNVAEVRSRGVEVMGTVQIAARMNVGGHYTYTDAEVTEGVLEGNDVEGAPEHAYGLTLAYVGPRMSVAAKWRYVDETFQDITNEAPQDAYSIVDLLAEWRLRSHLVLFLAGENVLDDEYVADGFGGELGAPRQVSVGVRLLY